MNLTSSTKNPLLIPSFIRKFLKLFGRNRPYSEIEPRVKVLVDCLNGITAVSTVASCQGHTYGKPPYVYFRAPVDVAAAIEQVLREIAAADRPILHAEWAIHGLFDETYQQTFLLHAPEYHRRANSIAAFWLFGVKRKRLNADLFTLAVCIEQAMLTNIRDVDKPRVGSHSG